MSEYRATCIKRDRQGRVFMAVGPLWWWIAGMSLVVAAGAVAYELLEGQLESVAGRCNPCRPLTVFRP